MSELEQVQVEAPAAPPVPQLTEVERIRAEDPEFPVTLAKARAKARGEAYNPEKHLPKEGKRGPMETTPDVEAGIQGIVDGWVERANRSRNWHERAIDGKQAAANDAP